MKKFLALIFGLLASHVWAIDSYNPTNGQLSIPSVSVGPTSYTNVVVTLGKVLEIGNFPAVGANDTYSPTSGILTIPSVVVGNQTYFNVSVTIGQIISVGENSTQYFPISGLVTGLNTGQKLTLGNNKNDYLSIDGRSGTIPFTFPSSIAMNGSYSISISNQPSGEICELSNKDGANVVNSVNNVTVSCYVPGTNAFTSGVNLGTISGAQTYQFKYTNGSSALFNWNADEESIRTTLADGTQLNEKVKATSLSTSVAADGVTTTATWIFPSAGWYSQNSLVTTDFSKAPVYTIPADLNQIVYPTSYLTPGNSSNYKLSDACDLNLNTITFPQSHMGSGSLPTIVGAPINKSIIRHASIKDIWSTDNPTSTNGCSSIGGARQEFIKLLIRFKTLNIDVIEPGPWTSIQIQADGSYKILDIAPYNESMPIDDFVWAVQTAHNAGFKVTWSNQIGTTVDLNNNLLPPTFNSDKNFQLFMNAYPSYMLSKASFLQSIGVETMMVSCYCAFVADNAFKAQIYKNTLESLIPQIKKIFKGKLLLQLDPVLQNSAVVASNVDLIEVGFGFAGCGNPTNTLSTPSKSSLLQLAGCIFQNTLQGYDKTKKYLVRFGVGSYSNFSSLPTPEETECVQDPSGLTNNPCWQRTIAPDFAQQANLYEAFFEYMNSQQLFNVTDIGVNNFFLTNNIIPTTVFEHIGVSPRSKPAEAVIKAWFQR